jgi:hypothetical protein
MNNLENYETAKRTAAKKLGFYIHSIAYVATIALLVIINLVTTPSYFWFIWPMIGWGIWVFAHGIKVFLWTGRSSIMDRMIHREIEMQEK